jgi:hypothetical protein
VIFESGLGISSKALRKFRTANFNLSLSSQERSYAFSRATRRKSGLLSEQQKSGIKEIGSVCGHSRNYLWDSEWGAAFWKTNAGLQKICDGLGPAAVQSFFARWSRRLPSVFTEADRRAGYGYEMAFRQFEISDTWVFDRPQAGRMWFEGVIRDHLDVGRPDQIALIFHRRVNGRTLGRFRTRVINPGVDPILCCYYKSSRIKQYFKEGRALRTETVICDTGDFGVERPVCTQNWNALRAVGESANRRLCDAEAADAQPSPDVATFCRVTRPSTNDDGLYAAALRFGEQRMMAILAALVGFCYLIRGFTNRQLVERVGALLQSPYTFGRRPTICAD